MWISFLFELQIAKEPKKQRKNSPCLKITEKVSFKTASEASYVYIFSGQKFIKNAKIWSILASFWKPEACGQTVLPDRSILIGQNLVENATIEKFKCDILGDFQTLWEYLFHIATHGGLKPLKMSHIFKSVQRSKNH